MYVCLLPDILYSKPVASNVPGHQQPSSPSLTWSERCRRKMKGYLSMRASFLRGTGHCTRLQGLSETGHCTRIQGQTAAVNMHIAYDQVANICAAKSIHFRCAASSEAIREGRRRVKEPGLICLNLLQYSSALLVISLSTQPLHWKPAETPKQPFDRLSGI